MAQVVPKSNKQPKTAYVAAHDLLYKSELDECCDTAKFLNLELVWDLSENPDVIIYAGGVDISPSLYGEDALGTTQSPNKYRDAVEVYTYRMGLEWGAIHIGICRGGQLLNVMNGGKLWQHVTHHTGIPGGIHGLKVNVPYNYTKSSYVVYGITSCHHQVMIPPRNGNERHNPYIIVAVAQQDHHKHFDKSQVWLSPVKARNMAPKDEIEGIWYSKTNSLCVQFHPGWNAASANVLKDLFNAYVKGGAVSCVA